MNKPMRIDGTVWFRTSPDQALPEEARQLLDHLRMTGEANADERTSDEGAA